MAQLVVRYGTPKDPAAFDAYHFGTHIPLAKALPGLRRYQVSTGPVAAHGGESGLHLVAILHFDSLADVAAAFASPEGQAAAADVPNFATGSVEMVMYDTKYV